MHVLCMCAYMLAMDNANSYMGQTQADSVWVQPKCALRAMRVCMMVVTVEKIQILSFT